MSELEDLKKEFPRMEYLDGNFYENHRRNTPLKNFSNEPINADVMIEDHYYPTSKKFEVSGTKEFIIDHYGGYLAAFKEI
ncbi:hypothetical protein [uncultured Clostridium sp.]|uniref:hypothetical protein n=1 Tax=uncultured Clostridium sp. TaxID=59620 RepID=UPI00261C90EC|nr:hypothetical protein [uncultured Clostridium sp.]